MFSVIHQPQEVRSTSIALVSRVPLIFYTFVNPQYFRLNSKSLNEVHGSCSVYIIHHRSDNEHVCPYIPEKKVISVITQQDISVVTQKDQYFKSMCYCFAPCCELKNVNHETTRVHLIMMKCSFAVTNVIILSDCM